MESPVRSTIKYQVPPPRDSKKAGYSVLLFGPVCTHKQQQEPYPQPEGAGKRPSLLHWGELQHMAAELGSYKQAHTSPPPLTLGNSRVVEGPAPLKELGSRAQAMRGSEPRLSLAGIGSSRPPATTATQTTLHRPLMDLPAGGEPTGRRTHVAYFGLSPAGSRGQRPGHQALACEPQPQAWLQGGAPGSTNACERTSFVFLRQELPVRLSNIMKEVNLLPARLLSTPSVQLVQSWYIQSLMEILHFLDRNPDDQRVLEAFVEVLEAIRNRHNEVVPTMAQGVIEYKDTFGQQDVVTDHNIQYFLDRFYTSRISIRMLINQHTLVFNGNTNPAHPNTIGCIDSICDVTEVVQDDILESSSQAE
ncbi:hypothetical protein L3Q82_002932 [Scortum barcoo]|uniref:Uncharacterized protein n=1 Tax=Scortum barcoo TaxID=214431 RepID=A0ACB8VV52_9TELE|nr:hypothetical protein L3Q82_002932 [Scortum barcoo]